MTAVEAVLLDAAGTLIRPREPVEATYASAARRCGAELAADQLSRAFGLALSEMPPLAFDWATRDELERKERAWWRRLVRRVVELTGEVREFDAFFDALYTHYARGRAWECFLDVIPALTELRAGGYGLAIVSNFDSRLPGILDDLGVSNLVDAVLYSTEARSAKPDPGIFRQALDALGVTPDRAIHVGDDPVADVQGAAAAGIEGFLIVRGSAPGDGADSVIGGLDELLEWLAEGRGPAR